MNGKLRRRIEIPGDRFILAVLLGIALASRLEAVPPSESSAEAQTGDATNQPGGQVPVQPGIKNTALQSGKISRTSKAALDNTASSSDQQLQRKVRRSLQDDPRTRPFAAQATVRNKKTTLAGHTYDAKDRDLAAIRAASVTGVLAVQNLIVVEPNGDLAIAERLHEAFSQDSIVHDTAIGVTVINGKVYLSGTALSSDGLARINQIVSSVPGVVAVSNGLELAAGSRTVPNQKAIAGHYSAYRSPYR